MDSIEINDGYTETKTVPAVPGLHPELKFTYRPALSRERVAYRNKLAVGDPEAVEKHETDLIVKYAVALNGEPVKDKERVGRWKPHVRGIVIDLILGYAPADEGADAKNS
jgi:hypothetical protein